VALGHDLVADRGVERSVNLVQQQRARIAVAKSVDKQLGEPGEDVANARTCRAHQRDRLGEEATADETEDLRGGVVEPLCVVNDADEGLLLGHLGEQCEHGEADHEAVGRRADA